MRAFNFAPNQIFLKRGLLRLPNITGLVGLTASIISNAARSSDRTRRQTVQREEYNFEQVGYGREVWVQLIDCRNSLTDATSKVGMFSLPGSIHVD